MKFSKLCLVMTDKCNACCDFCGFSCGPGGQQVIDRDLMLRVIREGEMLGVKSVSFSGGEPFLYPELLKDGIAAAREEKMAVNIATNGFWGVWDNDRIKAVLDAVKPDSVGFSYDFFHQKFVPEEHIMRAVTACLELDIKTTLYIADLKGEYSAGRFIRSLGVRKYGVELRIYPLYRCGRALNMPAEWFVNADMPENIGCLSDNTLSVLYNGDVYPCCRHEVFETAMKVGNVREKTLQDVLNESKVPMICDVLMKSGRFRRLLEIAKDSGIDIPEQAGCSCDYCRMLFGTDENMRQMLPHAETLYGEMLVRSLMKEVQDNDQ